MRRWRTKQTKKGMSALQVLQGVTYNGRPAKKHLLGEAGQSTRASLKAYARLARWQEAVLLLELRGGVPADVIMYSMALTACERGHQWPAALQLLDDMERTRLKADMILLSTAISSCKRAASGNRRCPC